MVVRVYKNIVLLLLALMLWGMAAGTANAFDFQGYAYNETKGALNNTNVSIEVYSFGQQGPQLITTHYNSSNITGYFNVSGISGGQPNFYKIILRHFNSTTNRLDYIGQSLPEFPYGMILSLTSGTPMDFYLRQGGTINISAYNLTGANKTFSYMIKDTRLGYPIASNFTSEVSNVVIYVPLNRNYSIMIYPNQSFPVSYDLNNLATYGNYYANISFNTSTLLRRVTGYANLSDGSASFTDLKIIAYLMEPGNMIFQDHPMPYNMSGWNCPGPLCGSDTYNATTGAYNITLPGAQMTANILLFATAYNGSNYYGAFKNISLGYSNATVTNFNFTMQTLLGAPATISLNNATGDGGPPGTTNVTTKKLSFQLKNSSSGTNITGFAHVEVEVNYSTYNGSTFKWMTDVSQTSNGSFSIPVISANINKINIFTQDFAPLKTSKTSSELTSSPVVINLTQFNPKGVDSEFSVQIDMLKSSTECDVPNPAASCSLFADAGGEKGEGDFNPFRIVIGGGKISLRMRLISNNITVHYKNVDLLASGPPDAAFDSSANQSAQNGTALEQAWRFGSLGPEIYDEVLVGIPLGSGIIPNNVSVKLSKLYDNSWNAVWNMSAGNTTGDLPSDYIAFNTTWFNSTTGMRCTGDVTSPCYVDVANRMIWLTIPHFSGVGPTVSGTVGNLTVTLTNASGIAGRSATMNFTIKDTLNVTSWFNITFPSGFNAAGAIVNISINGSADPPQWNKTAGTFFVNVSSTTVSASAGVNQSVNISNITLPSTTGTYVINVTTNNTNATAISLNYTVASYGVNLTVDSAAKTTSASVNATYTITLHNNGTATDAYNLTVANTNSASVAALNETGDITVASNSTRTLLLNVTNTSSGVFLVNVTARSLNDSTKFMYINTTTTVPIVITITSPANNNTTNRTGFVNVTVTLDNTGTAQNLSWNGVNYTMTPTTSQPAGTEFFINMTRLLSGNYTIKVYAVDSSGNSNASETRIVTVNRTNTTSLVSFINQSTFIVNTTISTVSPSGNVTVTVPNNTNASIGGTTVLTSLSVDSPAQVNSTYVTNLSSSDRFIGENLSLGPDNARFSPDIQIRLNYTDAQLTAAGITDESSLSVKFYNTSTNQWEALTTSSRDTTLNYTIVNVSHFSTFALIGTITSTTPTTSTGSSGSTGGGGVVSSESYANIAKAERYDKSLIANTPVTYTFKAPEHGIFEIAVTGKENENDITIRVEALKGLSKSVSAPPDGVVYRHLNIIAGTAKIKEAVIKFKIENSWLADNNLAGGEVRLTRWDGSKWNGLETAEKNKDGTFTFYEAKTTGFSSFAITGVKAVTPTAAPTEAAVMATPAEAPTTAPTPVPPEKETPGFEAIAAIIVITLLAASLVNDRKRR